MGAKKYHDKLFKNKKDEAQGKAKGVYAKEMAELVSKRRKAKLSFADSTEGDSKYFTDIKLVNPDERQANWKNNEIAMKSKKFYKADGTETKYSSEPRESRAKDPNRFEGTDLEFLTLTKEGKGMIGTKKQYQGKTDMEGRVKRQHAPKYRGSSGMDSAPEGLKEQLQELPHSYKFVDNRDSNINEMGKYVGEDQRYTMGFRSKTKKTRMDTSMDNPLQTKLEGSYEGGTDRAIHKFNTSAREETTRKYTAKVYMDKGIGVVNYPHYENLKGQVYGKSNPNLGAEKIAKDKRKYPDSSPFFPKGQVSSLRTVKPFYNSLKGEFDNNNHHYHHHQKKPMKFTPSLNSFGETPQDSLYRPYDRFTPPNTFKPNLKTSMEVYQKGLELRSKEGKPIKKKGKLIKGGKLKIVKRKKKIVIN